MADFDITEVSSETLAPILEGHDGPCVSIFMPTHRMGPETEQDKVLLKNLLARAAEQLESMGLRKPDIEALLEAPTGLLGDHRYWQHQLDGLALMVAPGFFEEFRLPLELKERVVVGDSFHIKPLLPALSEGHFYILALSMGGIRLLRGTRFGVEEFDLSELDIPKDLDDALRFDNFEKRGGDLQHRPTASGSAGGRQQFHGHGPGGEDVKKEVLRYFQEVDRGLAEILRAEHAPLVLAGVDYLLPIFKQASGYAHITQKGIEGNPEHLSAKELHQRAWELVQPLFRSDATRAAESYGALENQQRASCELTEVLPAAFQGRIEFLLLRKDATVAGEYDFEADSLTVHPDGTGVDLIDLTAERTLRAGGTIYVMDEDEMPCSSEVAALYRY